MQYVVTIEETLCRCYIVNAVDEQTAENIIKEAYDNEEIILNADDFDGVSFTACKYEYGELYELYPSQED